MNLQELKNIRARICELAGVDLSASTREIMDGIENKDQDGCNNPMVWLEKRHGIDIVLAFAALNGRWRDGASAVPDILRMQNILDHA